MSDVRAKYVPPAIDQRAFNCPHCGALTQQFWFTLHANAMSEEKTPILFDEDRYKNTDFDKIQKPEVREQMKRRVKRMVQKKPFPEQNRNYPSFAFDLYNIWFSKCFHCQDIAIWIYDRLIWPQRGEAPLPNPDLPNDIRRDYEEASAILDLSPRGAAALLRLSIQKLCKHLDGKGGKINDDIAFLVENGLPVQVQQALDAIRVIGNNAIHPGQLDLRDDRATAESLFALVNLIADSMIRSQPNRVSEIYGRLPEGALEAIEKRDAKQPMRENKKE